jgi:RHS repeat-associated protein
LVAILEENATGGIARTLLPVSDGLGSVTVVIDQATGQPVARFDFGPFGEPLGESGETWVCPFRWQTKWYDAESQQYYFGYRYYDPRLGRWLSRDPIRESGGFNLYAYCGNDPVNRHDPLGLDDKMWTDDGIPATQFRDSAKQLSVLRDQLLPLVEALSTEQGAINAELWGGHTPFSFGGLMANGGMLPFGDPLFEYSNLVGGMQGKLNGAISGLNSQIRFDNVEYQLRVTPNTWSQVGGRWVGAHEEILRKAYGSSGLWNASRQHLATKIWSPGMISLQDKVTTYGPILATLPFDLPAVAGLVHALRGSEVLAAASLTARSGPLRNVLHFEGLEIRAVRDLSHLDKATLEAMQQYGFAATTKNGDTIILHHLGQNRLGPLVEMPSQYHNIWNTTQHPFRNAAGVGLTQAERAAYNAWRIEYWKLRATQELNLRRILGR